MCCSTRFNSWTRIISDLCKLSNSSIQLDPVMFAEDTRLFYFNHKIKVLFETVNCELRNISQWFRANKLSLNMKKTKYTSFCNYSNRDKISLKRPALKRGNNMTDTTPSIKFLRVMLDGNVSWKYHIKNVENKLSKSISLLCLAKQFVDETSLKTYFSGILSVLNYASIAWASTHFIKLKAISYKQKSTWYCI